MGLKLGPLFFYSEKLDIIHRSSFRPHHLEEDVWGWGALWRVHI